MNINQLRYFCGIASKKSYSQAAYDMHVAQPYLSKCMKDLEKELGGKLFERHGRGIRLTAAGGLFYAHAQNILNELDWATAEFRKSQSRLIEANVYIGVAPQLIRSFFLKYRSENHETSIVARTLFTTTADSMGGMDLLITDGMEPNLLPGGGSLLASC